mmetsp:Transcript_14363/g.35028  ORF Transcript_14363/g.35028 Transcript_14363/m.35028 type:complete len:89 (-) Transcript_14363:802-1068(-)
MELPKLAERKENITPPFKPHRLFLSIFGRICIILWSMISPRLQRKNYGLASIGAVPAFVPSRVSHVVPDAGMNVGTAVVCVTTAARCA